MHDKIMRVLAVLALAIAAIGFTATPAQASAADCPTGGYVCFWVDRNYSGNMYKWSYSQVRAASGHCVVFSSGIDNKTSSILSTMSSIGGPMTFFDLAGGGSNIGKTGNFSDNDLAVSGGGFANGWNDRITSICAL